MADNTENEYTIHVRDSALTDLAVNVTEAVVDSINKWVYVMAERDGLPESAADKLLLSTAAILRGVVKEPPPASPAEDPTEAITQDHPLAYVLPNGPMEPAEIRAWLEARPFAWEEDVTGWVWRHHVPHGTRFRMTHKDIDVLPRGTESAITALCDMHRHTPPPVSPAEDPTEPVDVLRIIGQLIRAARRNEPNAPVFERVRKHFVHGTIFLTVRDGLLIRLNTGEVVELSVRPADDADINNMKSCKPADTGEDTPPVTAAEEATSGEQSTILSQGIVDSFNAQWPVGTHVLACLEESNGWGKTVQDAVTTEPAKICEGGTPGVECETLPPLTIKRGRFSLDRIVPVRTIPPVTPAEEAAIDEGFAAADIADLPTRIRKHLCDKGNSWALQGLWAPVMWYWYNRIGVGENGFRDGLIESDPEAAWEHITKAELKRRTP